MAYLRDLLYYMSGTECPESFLTWSGLSLAGAVAGRKIWTMHGDYFPVYPNLYVCMVGTPGSGKSTAKDLAKDIFEVHFPNHLISDEIQSREHICTKMAAPEAVHTWQDTEGRYGEAGKIYEWRPFYALIDELSLFVSVDIKNMINFLVGIHSNKSFGTGFKRDEGLQQRFRFPYFSMLACTIPDWIMSNLRLDLFNGGLGRRLIIVYDEKTRYVDKPTIPQGGTAAFGRVVEHLLELGNEKTCFGEVHRTPSAELWWKEWYNHPEKRINREDPILMQFHETKHIMLLKVATLLAMEGRPFRMQMTDEHLTVALAMLDELEPKIIRLTSGIGRNELAGIAAQILDRLEMLGGAVSEKRIRIQFFRHLRQMEWEEVKRHLAETGQIVLATCPDEMGVTRNLVFLPKNWEAVKVAKRGHESDDVGKHVPGYGQESTDHSVPPEVAPKIEVLPDAQQKSHEGQ